jgi:hypothetical protein
MLGQSIIRAVAEYETLPYQATMNYMRANKQ